MRTFFSIIALFSLCTLHAQSHAPSYGRELPRATIIAYPTAEEATAGASAAALGTEIADNRYFTQLGEWTHTGNVFSTTFTVPFAWANRQVLFRLGWASSDYEVRVNDRTVAYNGNGNGPADFNITRYAQEGRNTLEILLKSPSEVAQLESWKQATPAPAIGPASVMSQPTMRVRDVLTRTWQSDSTYRAEVAVALKSDALNPRTSRIYYELLTPSGRIAVGGFKDLTLKMRGEDTVRFLATIPDNLLWSTSLPTQYTLRLRTQYEGRNGEFLEFRIGFRALESKDGKLTVNGEPVSLCVRKVSPETSHNELIRLREQGYNALWLLPGIVPESFYDFCDAEGLYVIAQAPIDTSRNGDSRRKGGNPTNDPAWLGPYLERTADTYHTSKRHPSVIAFALAAQSANGINLYESYLAMKRFGDQRPFIYPDAAGEWNTDRLEMSFTPSPGE